MTEKVVKIIKKVVRDRNSQVEWNPELKKGLRENDATREKMNLHEMMSKKHFQEVVKTVSAIPDTAKRQEFANHHARIFAKDNPRFDHKRFHQACGTLHEGMIAESSAKGQSEWHPGSPAKSHEGVTEHQDLNGPHKFGEHWKASGYKYVGRTQHGHVFKDEAGNHELYTKRHGGVVGWHLQHKGHAYEFDRGLHEGELEDVILEPVFDENLVRYGTSKSLIEATKNVMKTKNH